MAKIARLALRLLPLFALLFLVAAAFAYPDSIAKDADRKVIDTAGPVEANECSSCHKDIDAWDNPNIINFSHSVHFKRGIRCRACHTSFPHKSGGTERPTMAACVNCHRLEHGDLGQMAPGKCSLCHPGDFKLKPDDHTAEFVEKEHETPAARNVQPCLVCHQAQSCEGCHDAKGLASDAAKGYRWYGLWQEPPARGEKIVIGATPVTMGTCQACHRDLQKWTNPNLVNFNHAAHFKRDIKCDECHDKWPHLPDKVEKPLMDSCVRCHRLEHGKQGRVVNAEAKQFNAGEYCFLCHPRDMKLKPDWHTAEFTGGDHKKAARADRGRCRACHIQSFCDSCHQTEIPHRSDWRGEHGKAAAAFGDDGDNLLCFRCHLKEGPRESYQSASSCAKCHKAVVYPHPKPWAPEHGKTAKRVGLESCQTCHVKKAFCDKCHGGIKMPHPTDWLGKHRPFVQTNSYETCMNCHEAGQCERCHAAHGLHNQHTNYKFEVGR